jgi:HK97 family phage portal protein
MAFKSFGDRVNAFISGSIQKSLNPTELTGGIVTPVEKNIGDLSIEKSSKGVIAGFRDYDRYGQKREDEAYRVSTRTMRLMYHNNPVIRAAVDTIINEVVAAKYDIVPVNKDDKLTKADKDKMQKKIDRCRNFFKHPNDRGENFQTIIKKMMKDLLLLDAGVLEKVPYEGAGENDDDHKGLAELYAIDGGNIRIDADPHGDVNCYWQVLEEEGIDPIKFDKDRIIYIMNNPRTDSLYGLSPLETLHNSVTAFLYGESYNIKYFENDARPSGIVDLGMSVPERELDRFREYWRAEHQQKPHRVMVVGGGGSGVKWVPISTTPKDMEMMNYLNWLMKIILMVFGVSPAEVGWTEDVQRAPATGAMLQSLAFKNRAIYPMMGTLSHYITESIINQEFGYEDLQFEFIEETSIPDKIQKAQFYQYAVMGKWMTVNEIRKAEGMEPLKLSPEGEPILGADQGVVEEAQQGGMGGATAPRKPINWDKLLGGLSGKAPAGQPEQPNVDMVDGATTEPTTLESVGKNTLTEAFKNLRDDVLTYVDHRAKQTDKKLQKSMDEVKSLVMMEKQK